MDENESGITVTDVSSPGDKFNAEFVYVGTTELVGGKTGYKYLAIEEGSIVEGADFVFAKKLNGSDRPGSKLKVEIITNDSGGQSVGERRWNGQYHDLSLVTKWQAIERTKEIDKQMKKVAQTEQIGNLTIAQARDLYHSGAYRSKRSALLAAIISEITKG